MTSELTALEWNRMFCTWLWQAYLLEVGHGASGWVIDDFEVSENEVRVSWAKHGNHVWRTEEDASRALSEFRATRGLPRTFPDRRPYPTSADDWWLELHGDIAGLPDVLTDFAQIRYRRIKRIGDVALVTVSDGKVDEDIDIDLGKGFEPGVPVEIGELYGRLR